MENHETTLATVREYYGRILKGSKDLKTSACCSTESFPPEHRAILDEIDSEILERFYGCGSPIPAAIEGCTVLDLGCGSGRDVYLASKLVGPDGLVIGIDMTDEQLSVARRHLESQTSRFGFKKPNVDFRHGYIEDLAACGIADNSIDLVISNCVINLSPDKEQVFREIFRVLKPGGELYFADVFADRRMPRGLGNDPLLYGECLGGALYLEDFRRLLRSLGCIPGSPHSFTLDDHHTFFTGKPMLVCGNSSAMVQETRFARHFTVIGDRSVHHGAFPCGPSPTTASEAACAGASCC